MLLINVNTEIIPQIMSRLSPYKILNCFSHTILGDFRGLGLLYSLEIVESKDSKTAAPELATEVNKHQLLSQLQR